jgi:putative endonuclease
MKPISTHNYFVYIITNKNKTTFYTGVTNDLATRLYQHKTESCTTKKTFAGKYNCVYLVFYEHFDYIEDAIDREKEIKGWTRNKKVNLIEKINPNWLFLNDEIEE